jgi:topoisomerase IV subunit B
LTVLDEPNGTLVTFDPDPEIFRNFHYISDYVVNMIKYYTFLNAGLVIEFNGEKFYSRNGLRDLLEENMDDDPIYPIIHLKGEDIEIAVTHGNRYGEDYYSFVNGQHTTQGGTHLQAFREVYVKTIRDFYKKDFDPSDIRASIVAAVSIKVEEPVFESQTKTKLGSKDIGPNGPSVRAHVGNFLQKELDNFLHKHQDTAENLLRRIVESERERKPFQVLKNSPNSGPRRLTFITKSFATAVFISTAIMKGLTNPVFLSLKVIRPAALLPNQGM